MRIPFLAAANRLTGVSTPVFGLSWNPPALDVDVARELLTFLEDRRVLFNPMAWEVPPYVVASVNQVRERLTDVLTRVDRGSPIGESAAAMRASCRRFLNQVGAFGSHGGPGHSSFDERQFSTALGELRGFFGVHVARISAAYGIDVEDDLASILPEEVEESGDMAAPGDDAP